MSVGHGTPGLRDFLRPFADLVDDVDADRRPILEFFPGVETTPGRWLLYSGSAYGYAGQIQYTLDGALRDIAGVDTDLGPLTRAESLADVVATAGTFFAQVGTAAAGVPFWDDGVTLWDGGQTFDQDQVGSLDLYVHLPGGVAPLTHTIVPLLGFYFGSRSEIHPRLGPDKLTNGPFESLTGWTESLAGAGFSSALDAVLFTGRGSANSLKLVSTGAATGNATRRQDLTTIVGERYRLSGDYRTDLLFSANLAARLLIQNTGGTVVLYSDGRDGDASGGVTLKPTVGEWRRFMFDFVAPATTTRVQLQLLAASSAGAGQFNVDNMKVQRIYGFQYYDPRLAAASLPEVEVASQSIFFAGKTVGLGDFSLMNADGLLDSIFGQLLLKNRSANVLVGGTFPDAQEVYRDDYRGGWPGLTQRVDADDLLVRFQTEDARAKVHVTLPPRAHSLADDPDMDLTFEGYGRRLIFATNHGTIADGSGYTAPILWKPVRTARTANGYGIYEVGDVNGSLNGLHSSTPVVVVYPTEAMAEKDIGGRCLDSTDNDFTYNQATGLLTITNDVRNRWQLRDGTDRGYNLGVIFDIGGANLSTFIDFALGSDLLTAEDVAARLTTGMNGAAGTADISVTYSHSTHKFTIAKGAGTLNLRLTVNTLAQKFWNEMGWNDTTADLTGSLSYTAPTAVFSDADADHFIRVSASGLRDDASGTITGTANGPAYKHPDIARYALTQIAKEPSANIDAASFVAGRALDSGGCRIVLQEGLEFGEFLSRLERGAIADLVVDTERIWRWRAYQAGATAMRDFFDRDFLTFKCGQNPENIFKAVRVRYGHNPALGTSKSYEYAADTGIPTEQGRNEIPEWETFMDGDLDSVAQTQTQRLARLAAADPLVVEFTARGKLVDLLIGDVITITRSRALTSTGALAATRFLVRALRHNFLTGVSGCVAVEDVAFLSA